MTLSQLQEALKVPGYKPTDADIKNIHAAGLRLVSKPDLILISSVK